MKRTGLVIVLSTGIVLLAFTLLLTGCGGGGGGGGGAAAGGTSGDAANTLKPTLLNTQTATVSEVTEQLMIQASSNPNLAILAGSLTQVNMANSLLAMVQAYQSLALQSTPTKWSAADGISVLSARATWTWSATSGGLTITLSMTETATQAYDWSLTINGTDSGGQTFDDFEMAHGDVKRDTLDGKRCCHEKITIHPEPGHPLIYIFGEIWAFDDGSVVGYWDYTGVGSLLYLTWELKTDGSFYLALWEGLASDRFKTFEAQINLLDGSGWFKCWCFKDKTLTADCTFTAYGQHGSGWTYPCACSPGDPHYASW